jgi:hypothetical protein
MANGTNTYRRQTATRNLPSRHLEVSATNENEERENKHEIIKRRLSLYSKTSPASDIHATNGTGYNPFLRNPDHERAMPGETLKLDPIVHFMRLVRPIERLDYEGRRTLRHYGPMIITLANLCITDKWGLPLIEKYHLNLRPSAQG